MLAATMTRGKVTLHSPHSDPVFSILLLPNQDLFFPGHLRDAVEDDQIALLGTDPIRRSMSRSRAAAIAHKVIGWVRSRFSLALGSA